MGEKFFYLSNSHWLSIQDSLAVACCKKRLRKGKLNNWVMKINWIYALLRRKWWRIICPWENRSEIKYIVLPSREIKLRCISFNLESILPSHQKPKWLLLFVKKQLSMSLDRSLRGPIIEALCCQLTMYTILGMIRERQLLLNQLIKPKNIDTWQFFSTLYRLTMTDHGKDHENITWWLSRCS